MKTNILLLLSLLLDFFYWEFLRHWLCANCIQSLPSLLFLIMKVDFSTLLIISYFHFYDPWRQEIAIRSSTLRFLSSWQLDVWQIITGVMTWIIITWIRSAWLHSKPIFNWSFHGILCNSLYCKSYWSFVQEAAVEEFFYVTNLSPSSRRLILLLQRYRCCHIFIIIKRGGEGEGRGKISGSRWKLSGIPKNQGRGGTSKKLKTNTSQISLMHPV